MASALTLPALSLHASRLQPLARHVVTLRQRVLRRQQDAGLGSAAIKWLNPAEEGGALPGVPTYDLVVTMDAVHDMTRPEAVMSALRQVGPMRELLP